MVTAAQIKFVRSLSEKKIRNENSLFVAEGSKLINDLAKTKLVIEQIFALEGAPVDFDSLGVTRVSNKEMSRMSNLKTPSDAIAMVGMPSKQELEFSGLSIMLDGIQDPGNIGTIIRIADWFGIKRIICSENCADCFAPKVVQATMGSIARVDVYYTDLLKVLESAVQQGIGIFGTFLEGENIYQSTLPASGIIVMGNEGRGISAQVAEKVTNKLLIPAFDSSGNHCESLNVAAATAIICSEFRRR
ncbi:MAG: RNA methyltransferase [Rikenellaceae bacterium]